MGNRFVTRYFELALQLLAGFDNELNGVVLMTLDWICRQRVLRVEWAYVDPCLPHHDLIKRRLWLRVAAVAISASCNLVPNGFEESHK